jgi:D-sedoheptulose 7-phosphate isomerase
MNISKKKKFESFFKDYILTLENKLKNIQLDKLFVASELILKTIKRNKHIYVCGNGGSGAIADHYICDFFKQLSKYTNLKAKIRSLNSDQYLLSAISNDISYSDIFSVQAERYFVTGDILIIISSSGNSANIKKVLKFCKKKRIKTIGFSNFSGGFLDKNSDISIHSKVNNYGVGEDINHILMHLLMQFIAKTNLNIENIKNKKIIL